MTRSASLHAAPQAGSCGGSENKRPARTQSGAAAKNRLLVEEKGKMRPLKDETESTHCGPAVLARSVQCSKLSSQQEFSPVVESLEATSPVLCYLVTLD